MERAEILEKARKEKQDGWESQVRDRSLKWTVLVLAAVAAILAGVRASRGQPMMDLCVTVCAAVSAGHLYRFFKLREKHYLVLGVILLLVAAFALVRFCMGH